MGQEERDLRSAQNRIMFRMVHDRVGDTSGDLRFAPELDFVCECAAEVGPPLRRGSRSWTSTDGCVPLIAGYPTATLVSLTPWKMLANYHWPSDVPENVDFGTVAQATEVSELVIRRLASGS